MTITIRQYQDRDLSDVLAAWESASRLAHPFLTEQFLQQARQDIPKLYLPIADTWVVEDNGQVVGFIALIGNMVGALFLQPDFHGRGIGKALMDKARALHTTLTVEVFKENTLGRAFYDRYGFTLQQETIFEPTGDTVLRLAFSG